MRWQQEYVERLVGPLPLREREKDRLREELWGHLDALYQEEQSDGLAPADAQRTACEKLGRVEDLAGAFGSCETPAERIDRLIAQTAYGTSEGNGGHAWQVSRILGSCSFALLLLSSAAAESPGMTWGTALLTWITVSMLLVPLAGCFHLFVNTMTGFAESPAKSAFVLWMCCCVVCGAAWLAGLGATLILCAMLERWDLLPVFHVFSREVYLTACLLLPALGFAGSRTVRWREYRSRNLPDWPYPGAAGEC